MLKKVTKQKEFDMKKFLALFLTIAMVISFAACGKGGKDTSSGNGVVSELPENATVGQTLLHDFQTRVNADSSLSVQDLADAISTNEIIQFGPVTMPVEPGLLTGFGNTEITGFKEGVMFAPMIGSIPFVGYVFLLEDGTDAAAFEQTLKDNANPRWNICTEADETVVGSVGNTVFFVMCPAQFEE